MYKKSLSVIVLLGLLCSAAYAGNGFMTNGGDWDNPANWSAGVVPQDSTTDPGTATPVWNNDVEIWNGNTAVIADGTDATAYGLMMGHYGAVSGVNMTGGSLTVGSWGLNIGRGELQTGSFGTFQMSGGVLNADYINLPEQWGTASEISGLWIMDGGVANAGWLRLGGENGTGTGTLELNGGEINLNSFEIGGTNSSMDIAGGTLIITGDYESTIQGYIDSGWITAYGGALGGQINMDYNDTNIGKTTVTSEMLSLEMKAHDPSPDPNSTEIITGARLSWSSGLLAESHHVYLGTDYQAVFDADDPNVLPGRGSVSKAYYDTTLDPGKTYYWRVDEVTDGNPESPWKGDVWSFTTLDPLAGDVNYDWVVDIQDLREIAAQWLEDTCLLPDWCDGADLDKSTKVDLIDFSKYAQNMLSSAVIEPPYTDYNAMLSQEIQGKKHGFMAGNLTYYIGGRYGWDDPRPSWYEDETIGLTHPFHHDLRSRGHGMVSDPDTGYGHDYQGWEFWKDTKVAYGSVWVGGTKYTNPVPTAMYWQPDKMICEYSVAGVTIQEEKFIADNDAACTIITSSAPVTLEFEGQSFANNKTINTTATCTQDIANNAVHIVEGGTVEVKPTDTTVTTGVMTYDGMSTVISTSRPMTDYTQAQVNTIVSGQWTYSFKVPCDSSGVSLVWSMDDSYSVALSNVQDVLADPAVKMQAKSDEMNNILNTQIPYFRCSDQDIVDVYYYLWSIYLMYYIDVDQGFEQYPHTQSAVNNFLGMHRYDANLQIPVGSWTVDKEAYANGNVLIWSALLPYANLSTGRIPADNMGIGWYSGLWGAVTGHVEGAWQIYEHSGDLSFLSDAYDFYKALMWQNIPVIWGQEFNAADCLAKMANELGYPSDADHWYDLVNMDGIDNWLTARWETSIPNWFLGGDPMGWSSMAYMGMDAFPDLWAWYMTEHWAMDSVDGFYSSVPLAVRAIKDWDSIAGLDNDFVITPDTNWWAIRGMYKHHVCKNANTCTLGHLKNYHMNWGIPIAPESFDRDPADDTLAPWGDQYSNFNAGKISLILDGILGLSYSVVDDHFTVSDHLPTDWDYMETYIPINENGNTEWTKVRVSRNQNGSSVVKTIEVEGNTRSKLNIEPWLEEKDLTNAPAGYANYQPRGHIGYQFDNIKNKTITVNLEEGSPSVSIMPLGDSITDGGDSYRKRLYELLTGDGYAIDMVGSMNSGSFADTDHEGHNGWHADAPATTDDIVGQIDNWLTLNPADIVLLHIGTNDVSGGEDPAEVAAILDIIKSKDPRTTIIVARIILRNDTASPETIVYNDGIEAIVNARIMAGDNLVLVDMENVLSYPADLVDNVHPTVVGYEKMADVWYPAVKNIIGRYD